MAGKSKKEMHPYMEELMYNLGCENLHQMAEETKIPLATLRSYAFENRLPINKERAEHLAQACGVSYNDLMEGLMSTGVAIHHGEYTLNTHLI